MTDDAKEREESVKDMEVEGDLELEDEVANAVKGGASSNVVKSANAGASSTIGNVKG
jgi:hypothetical protein